MANVADDKRQAGPYEPCIIIHGGAGAISRKNLPPDLYLQYHNSLLKYLKEGQALLATGSSALDAACHAVSLMEDDPLFNCGKGSVFTKDGTIEMEASVMVASLHPQVSQPGSIKRGAAVSMIRYTRHPILLAKEVLLSPDETAGLGGTDTMHCHLSGSSIESWGFDKKGLEKKSSDWFWTKRRWEEHRKGLEKVKSGRPTFADEETMLPSQGTVGAVCVDTTGGLAVATSTGGLTNKSSGRIGDTPTLGSGFWAESWIESRPSQTPWLRWTQPALSPTHISFERRPDLLNFCLGMSFHKTLRETSKYLFFAGNIGNSTSPSASLRAIAMSGTGNGDSFLRTSAVRTAAALCRFSGDTLSTALEKIAGPGGELQLSAGDRWKRTGEGEGGIIGVELIGSSAKVFSDFNCGGLWRAWYDNGIPKVMVFREDYSP